MFPFISQGQRKEWARRRQHESIEIGGGCPCGHGCGAGAFGRRGEGTVRGDLR